MLRRVLPGLAMVALLAGCGGDADSAPPKQERPALVRGSGATFPAPLYEEWTQRFNKTHPGVLVGYEPIGSGGGVEQFSAGITAFGASDAPMTDEELSIASSFGGEVLHVPTALGAVVASYNLAGVSVLRLDGRTLADIFLRKITRWDDPLITSLNTDVLLPPRPIVVVHRADSSGTTFVFSGYLSLVSAQFRNRVGQSKAPEWPSGKSGDGNAGVVAAIKKTPGAIGYVELAYALEHELPAATIKNASGRWIGPTTEATSAGAMLARFPADLRFSLLNSPAPAAYPIVSATWQLVWREPRRADLTERQAKALIEWLRWELSTGQTFAASLGYAPLPPVLLAAARAKVQSIRADAG